MFGCIHRTDTKRFQTDEKMLKVCEKLYKNVHGNRLRVINNWIPCIIYLEEEENVFI